MGDLREALADYAHEAWSSWMDYLFSRSTDMGPDGVLIPRPLVDRWERQIATPYADLPENEKESDRKEADRMLALVLSAAIFQGLEHATNKEKKS